MDLAEFVAARLDEDEREIRNDPPSGMGYAVLPRRMLREVAAKRAILARHLPLAGLHGTYCAWCSTDTDTVGLDVRWPCPDVRDLAAVWTDSAGYDPAWAPAS